MKMGKFVAIAASLAMASAVYAGAIINEFHYDNVSTDSGEFIEVYLDGGTAANTVTVTLYNGSGGASYGTKTVDTMTNAGGGYYVWEPVSGGIQNGAPDGIAISISGVLVEFLSYEGTFTATNGVANAVLSTDIGVSQAGSEPVGSSLQRVGFGSTWLKTDGSNTKGAVNVPEPATLALLAISGLFLRRRSA